MIPVPFTQEEVAALKHEKDSPPVPKVRRRCEIVYLKSQGFMHNEIEKIVGSSHGTVTNTLKLYTHGNLDALKTLNYKGPPSPLHRYPHEINVS